MAIGREPESDVFLSDVPAPEHADLANLQFNEKGEEIVPKKYEGRFIIEGMTDDDDEGEKKDEEDEGSEEMAEEKEEESSDDSSMQRDRELAQSLMGDKRKAAEAEPPAKKQKTGPLEEHYKVMAGLGLMGGKEKEDDEEEDDADFVPGSSSSDGESEEEYFQ
jgi:hypothetical protein